MANTRVQIVIDAVDNASKVIKNMTGGFKGLEQNLRSTGTGLMALGAAPTAALAGITIAAINFEDAFAGVRKTVDASDAEFKQIAKNFREISKVTPVTAIELSRIGELAGQLGVKGVDNISKFAKVMADISVTTNLTAENASTAFARIVNIMQEPIENVDRMGATVVELGNNFATTEAEIVEFATRIAGAGSIAGLATDEIFGIGAAMSSVGVQAEAGGTAVQKVLIAMNTAVTQGNEDLAVFADTAGLTLDEFKNLSAIERFNRFVLGLGHSGDGAISVLEDLGLQDQRLIRSFLSLANAGDLVLDTSESAAEAWRENNALTEEAAKRYETVASQMTILKNNITDVALVLGESLLPKIIELIDKAKPLVARFADFAEQNPGLIKTLLVLGAVIGTLGTAMAALSFMLPGIKFLITAIFLSPVGAAIIGVIGAVIIMFLSLRKSLDNTKKGFEIWEKKIIPAVVDGFKKLADTITGVEDSIELFKKFVKNTSNIMKEWVGNIITTLEPWRKDFRGTLDTTLENAKTSFERFKTETPRIIEEWGNKIDEALKPWKENFAETFLTTLNNANVFLRNWILEQMDLWRGAADEWLPVLVEGWSRMGQVWIEGFKFMLEQTKIQLQFLLDAFLTFWTVAVPAVVIGAVMIIGTAIETFFTETLPHWVVGLGNWMIKIQEWWEGLGPKFEAWVTDLGPSLMRGLDTLWNNVKAKWDEFGKKTSEQATDGFVKDKPNMLLKIAESIWIFLGLLFLAMVAGFISLGGKFSQAIINGMADGIRSLGGLVEDAVGELIDKVRDKFGGILGDAYGWGKDIISNFISGIRDAISELVGGARSFVIDKLGVPEDLIRQTGGMVPGPIGAPVGITAHAGERIIPAGVSPGTGGGGGGGNVTFEVNIGMYAGTETEKRDIAHELYGALVQVAQSQNKTVEELFGEV